MSAKNPTAYVIGPKPGPRPAHILNRLLQLGTLVVAVSVASSFFSDDQSPASSKPAPSVSEESSVVLPSLAPPRNSWDLSSNPDPSSPPSSNEELGQDRDQSGSPSSGPFSENQLSKSPSDPSSQALPPAYDLPIDVQPTDTTPSLAMKFWQARAPFQALALQAEGLETAPYYIEGDKSQPSIGVGYNVQMSIGAIGEKGVRDELTRAGIPDQTIDQLMSKDHAVSSQAQITTHQALSLLDIATERFTQSARDAVGERTFDRLPKHRQIALIWIDYNSNLHNRPKLLRAVRAGDHERAVKEMETWATIHGRRQLNPQTLIAQAMYWDEDHYRDAVLHPEKAKRDVAHAPWNAPDQSNHDLPSTDDDLIAAARARPSIEQFRARAQSGARPDPGSSPSENAPSSPPSRFTR